MRRRSVSLAHGRRLSVWPEKLLLGCGQAQAPFAGEKKPTFPRQNWFSPAKLFLWLKIFC
jgi:hypothetical protein